MVPYFHLHPGKCRSFILDEIPVEGLTSRDVECLKQKVYEIMEKKLIEYKATWITNRNRLLKCGSDQCT